MAKPMPFPVHLYKEDCVKSLNLSAGAYFRLIIEKYWDDGKPLPQTDWGFTRTINADPKTWRIHKAKVLAALAIMLPKFNEYRESRLRTTRKQQLHAVKLRVKLKDKRQSKTTHFSDVNSNPSIGVKTIPSSPNPFNVGMHDPIARKQALKSTKDKPQTTFTDD